MVNNDQCIILKLPQVGDVGIYKQNGLLQHNRTLH